MDSHAKKEDASLRQPDTHHVAPNSDATESEPTGATIVEQAEAIEAKSVESVAQGLKKASDDSTSHQPDQASPLTNALPLASQQKPEQQPEQEPEPEQAQEQQQEQQQEQPQPQPQHPQLNGLDVDSGWDADSAIGTEDMPSTRSIRSSVYAYIEENGRRYHRYKEGKYHFPNDEREQDRLDLQHHIFMLTLDGKLGLAPIEDIPGGVQNVLDIGTGTGIWAIDLACAFPSASVLGTDLSPIQPEFVPPNCRFEVDDAEDAWMFSQQFDYIHGRMLGSCFASHLNVFRSAFDAMRPGGWIEMQDYEFPFRCVDDSIKGTGFERWVEAVLEGCAKLGRDWKRVPLYSRYMKECGFVDVQERLLAWPIGSWAKNEKMKTLGAWTKENVLEGMQGWSVAVLTRGLGMSPEEVELMLMEARNAINSRKLHVYVPIYIVYGRKP